LIKRNKLNSSQPLAQPLAQAPMSAPMPAPMPAPILAQSSSQPAASAASAGQVPLPNLSNSRNRQYQPLSGGKYKSKLGKSRKIRNP
jgi:hypothetical protein